MGENGKSKILITNAADDEFVPTSELRVLTKEEEKTVSVHALRLKHAQLREFVDCKKNPDVEIHSILNGSDLGEFDVQKKNGNGVSERLVDAILSREKKRSIFLEKKKLEREFRKSLIQDI